MVKHLKTLPPELKQARLQISALQHDLNKSKAYYVRLLRNNSLRKEQQRRSHVFESLLRARHPDIYAEIVALLPTENRKKLFRVKKTEASHESV